jgi:hypothetical protein
MLRPKVSRRFFIGLKLPRALHPAQISLLLSVVIPDALQHANVAAQIRDPFWLEAAPWVPG